MRANIDKASGYLAANITMARYIRQAYTTLTVPSHAPSVTLCHAFIDGEEHWALNMFNELSYVTVHEAFIVVPILISGSISLLLTTEAHDFTTEPHRRDIKHRGNIMCCRLFHSNITIDYYRDTKKAKTHLHSWRWSSVWPCSQTVRVSPMSEE